MVIVITIGIKKRRSPPQHCQLSQVTQGFTRTNLHVLIEMIVGVSKGCGTNSRKVEVRSVFDQAFHLVSIFPVAELLTSPFVDRSKAFPQLFRGPIQNCMQQPGTKFSDVGTSCHPSRCDPLFLVAASSKLNHIR